MFPVAAGPVLFLRDAVAHVRRMRRVPPGLRREAGFAVGVVVLMAGLLPAVAWAGTRLREGHRFGVQVCTIAGKATTCLWQPDGPGASAVHGVWNGVGLRLSAHDGDVVRARSAIALPAGRYRLRAEWDVAPASAPSGVRSTALRAVRVELRAGETSLARESLAGLVAAGIEERPLPIDATVEHAGGDLVLTLEAAGPADLPPRAALWLSGLSLEPASSPSSSSSSSPSPSPPASRPANDTQPPHRPKRSR
jgi:hypothetical protein